MKKFWDYFEGATLFSPVWVGLLFSLFIDFTKDYDNKYIFLYLAVEGMLFGIIVGRYLVLIRKEKRRQNEII